MKKLVKIPLYVAGAGAAAFVGTFTIYMFNLDMKLMAVVAPLLDTNGATLWLWSCLPKPGAPGP